MNMPLEAQPKSQQLITEVSKSFLIDEIHTRQIASLNNTIQSNETSIINALRPTGPMLKASE